MLLLYCVLLNLTLVGEGASKVKANKGMRESYVWAVVSTGPRGWSARSDHNGEGSGTHFYYSLFIYIYILYRFKYISMCVLYRGTKVLYCTIIIYCSTYSASFIFFVREMLFHLRSQKKSPFTLFTSRFILKEPMPQCRRNPHHNVEASLGNQAFSFGLYRQSCLRK